MAKKQHVISLTKIESLRAEGLTWEIIAQRCGYTNAASAKSAYCHRKNRKVKWPKEESEARIRAIRALRKEGHMWKEIAQRLGYKHAQSVQSAYSIRSWRYD